MNSIIQRVLKRFLCKIINDGENKIVWDQNGNLNIQNFTLNNQYFDSILNNYYPNLSCNNIEINALQAIIPWNSLYSHPVKVSISEVVAKCTLKKLSHSGKNVEIKTPENANAFWIQSDLFKNEEFKDVGVVHEIITEVLNNICMEIKNFRLLILLDEINVVAQINCGSLNLMSINEKNEMVFLTIKNFIRKMVVFKDIDIKVNCLSILDQNNTLITSFETPDISGILQYDQKNRLLNFAIQSEHSLSIQLQMLTGIKFLRLFYEKEENSPKFQNNHHIIREKIQTYSQLFLKNARYKVFPFSLLSISGNFKVLNIQFFEILQSPINLVIADSNFDITISGEEKNFYFGFEHIALKHERSSLIFVSNVLYQDNITKYLIHTKEAGKDGANLSIILNQKNIIIGLKHTLIEINLEDILQKHIHWELVQKFLRENFPRSQVHKVSLRDYIEEESLPQKISIQLLLDNFAVSAKTKIVTTLGVENEYGMTCISKSVIKYKKIGKSKLSIKIFQDSFRVIDMRDNLVFDLGKSTVVYRQLRTYNNTHYDLEFTSYHIHLLYIQQINEILQKINKVMILTSSFYKYDDFYYDDIENIKFDYFKEIIMTSKDEKEKKTEIAQEDEIRIKLKINCCLFYYGVTTHLVKSLIVKKIEVSLTNLDFFVKGLLNPVQIKELKSSNMSFHVNLLNHPQLLNETDLLSIETHIKYDVKEKCISIEIPRAVSNLHIDLLNLKHILNATDSALIVNLTNEKGKIVSTLMNFQLPAYELEPYCIQEVSKFHHIDIFFSAQGIIFPGITFPEQDKIVSYDAQHDILLFSTFLEDCNRRAIFIANKNYEIKFTELINSLGCGSIIEVSSKFSKNAIGTIIYLMNLIKIEKILTPLHKNKSHTKLKSNDKIIHQHFLENGKNFIAFECIYPQLVLINKCNFVLDVAFSLKNNNDVSCALAFGDHKCFANERPSKMMIKMIVNDIETFKDIELNYISNEQNKTFNCVIPVNLNDPRFYFNIEKNAIALNSKFIIIHPCLRFINKTQYELSIVLMYNVEDDDEIRFVLYPNQTIDMNVYLETLQVIGVSVKYYDKNGVIFKIPQLVLSKAAFSVFVGNNLDEVILISLNLETDQNNTVNFNFFEGAQIVSKSEDFEGYIEGSNSKYLSLETPKIPEEIISKYIGYPFYFDMFSNSVKSPSLKLMNFFLIDLLPYSTNNLVLKIPGENDMACKVRMPLSQTIAKSEFALKSKNNVFVYHLNWCVDPNKYIIELMLLKNPQNPNGALITRNVQKNKVNLTIINETKKHQKKHYNLVLNPNSFYYLTFPDFIDNKVFKLDPPTENIIINEKNMIIRTFKQNPLSFIINLKCPSSELNVYYQNEKYISIKTKNLSLNYNFDEFNLACEKVILTDISSQKWLLETKKEFLLKCSHLKSLHKQFHITIPNTAVNSEQFIKRLKPITKYLVSSNEGNKVNEASENYFSGNESVGLIYVNSFKVGLLKNDSAEGDFVEFDKFNVSKIFSSYQEIVATIVPMLSKDIFRKVLKVPIENLVSLAASRVQENEIKTHKINPEMILLQHVYAMANTLDVVAVLKNKQIIWISQNTIVLFQMLSDSLSSIAVKKYSLKNLKKVTLFESSEKHGSENEIKLEWNDTSECVAAKNVYECIKIISAIQNYFS